MVSFYQTENLLPENNIFFILFIHYLKSKKQCKFKRIAIYTSIYEYILKAKISSIIISIFKVDIYLFTTIPVCIRFEIFFLFLLLLFSFRNQTLSLDCKVIAMLSFCLLQVQSHSLPSASFFSQSE